MTRETVPPISRRERRAQERLDRPAVPRHRPTRRASRPAWQSPVVLITVAAVLVGFAVIALARPGGGTGTAELITPPTSYPAGIVDGEALGPATAPVVIKVYSDFQCPACRLFVTTELQRLVTDFVVPGTLRIEANDVDIVGSGNPNESLELAAGAACAAKQGRYWAFHDLVFWNQLQENHGDYDAAFIARVADAAAVDRTAWDTCFAGNDIRQPIVSRSSAAVPRASSRRRRSSSTGRRSSASRTTTSSPQLIRQLAVPPSPSALPSPVPSVVPS